MSEANQAVFKIFIRGSVEAVWREITKTDEPQGAMFNNFLETDGLKPGGQMRMRTVSRRYTGVVGEILEFDPPRRYVHTFKFTNLNDPACKVVHEVRAVEGGAEYTMTLLDLPVGTKTARQMVGGAKFIAGTLKSIVETGRPSFGTRLIFGLMGMLEWMNPKACRSENWPLSRKV